MKRHLAPLSIATLVLVANGCNGEDPNQLLTSNGTMTGCPTTTTGGGNGGDGGSGGAGGATTSSAGGGTTTTTTVEKTVLDERVLSYTEALRTASFKLVGNAPTLEETLSVANQSTDEAKKAKYEELIDKMMGDVRFKRRLVEFWRNTFRMAGPAQGKKPSRDTAPTFAAKIVFDKRPFTDLFTATEMTCPTFDGTDFKDGSCAPNGPPGMETVGILTDPGIHEHYYGNLAFLRVRFFQEVFACRKMPAEYNPDAKDPPPIPGCDMAQAYTNPWDFTKIAGHTNGGSVDFQDCSSVVCGNCHGTMNHRAPLLANFDMNGAYQPTISVLLPTIGTPVAQPTDWLVTGEATAWKIGMPAADLKQLGSAMAADDEVLQCAVTRVWNYAMSKGDVVINSSALSPEVIAPVVAKFKASNYNMNATWREIFLHDDFVRF
jgi:hypothetical protein